MWSLVWSASREWGKPDRRWGSFVPLLLRWFDEQWDACGSTGLLLIFGECGEVNPKRTSHIEGSELKQEDAEQQNINTNPLCTEGSSKSSKFTIGIFFKTSVSQAVFLFWTWLEFIKNELCPVSKTITSTLQAKRRWQMIYLYLNRFPFPLWDAWNPSFHHTHTYFLFFSSWASLGAPEGGVGTLVSGCETLPHSCSLRPVGETLVPPAGVRRWDTRERCNPGILQLQCSTLTWAPDSLGLGWGWDFRISF